MNLKLLTITLVTITLLGCKGSLPTIYKVECDNGFTTSVTNGMLCVTDGVVNWYSYGSGARHSYVIPNGITCTTSYE